MLYRCLWIASLPLAFVLQGCGVSAPSQLNAASEGQSISQDIASYYAGTADKDGDSLHAMLHDVIKGHNVLSYDETHAILKESDRDPNNPDNVILFYTGDSVRAGWNREHVWAKSIGFPKSNQPPYTDAHHLRPCNIALNSMRSSKQFAEVGGRSIDTNGNKVDDEFFEPADNFKGDVARIIFYMDVRYEGDAQNEPDLIVANDNLGNKRGSNTARFGKLSDLLRWNEEDPVDDMERHRNETIYKWQDNRNPFIDHPEFAQAIWGSQPAR